MAVIGSAVGFSQSAMAQDCMRVTLTGTQGGPRVYKGQAGAGTLVQYGDDTNNCAAISLQFDTGRGTVQRLSQAKTPAGKIKAIFFTHMHSDHTEGLADLMQLRWHFASKGPKVELVCSADVKSPLGPTISCSAYWRCTHQLW
ncbi:MAG: MBL fold metallo-hydrolase [Nitratireductor sp.]